jgi:hypothetical protein
MAALPLSLAKTKPKCSKNTIATQAKKEMTIVVYATTVSNPNIQLSLTCLISVNTIYKAIPRDKRKMPCWISIFKRIIPHINIQIQTIYRWQRQNPSAAKILSLHRQRKR